MSEPMAEGKTDTERAARVLESHPDYRILRRLGVRDDFGSTPQGAPGVAVVVDTETTGTDTRADHVIELAMVRFEYCLVTGAVCRVTEVYTEFDDPGEPIPPESTAIHGITDEMVRGRRIDEARVAQMLDGVGVVIAHNAAFDRPFLERRLPAFAQKPWACSHAQVPWAEEGFAGSKLEYLGVACGFFYDAHRSEIDCRALLEVLSRPLPKSGRTALGVMLERARAPGLLLWATGSPFDTKDALRARGYRWHAERRCWYLSLAQDQLDAECAWLKNAVYGGRAAQVEVEVQDAKVRFSGRPGTRRPRVI
jgi:DNA polymerase-3 subunit epsilon